MGGNLDKKTTQSKKAKIVQIPSSLTIPQMESALDNILNDGWKLSQIFDLAGNTYAIFVKEL